MFLNVSFHFDSTAATCIMFLLLKKWLEQFWGQHWYYLNVIKKLKERDKLSNLLMLYLSPSYLDRIVRDTS